MTMTEYWPVAKYTDADGNEQTLFTCLGCVSFKEAKEAIKTWAEDYQIVMAWIDEYEGPKKKERHELNNKSKI